MSEVVFWLSIVGGAVFVFGVGMLGFALKDNNNAEKRETALWTMAAGGAVAGLLQLAANFFGW